MQLEIQGTVSRKNTGKGRSSNHTVHGTIHSSREQKTLRNSTSTLAITALTYDENEELPTASSKTL
jgi:hypothetical protein